MLPNHFFLLLHRCLKRLIDMRRRILLHIPPNDQLAAVVRMLLRPAQPVLDEIAVARVEGKLLH